MAKSEQKSKPTNKRKRKHEGTLEEDEIPSKSLIVESNHEEQEQTVHKPKKGTKKSSKRKLEATAAVKTKRTKKASVDINDEESEEDQEQEQEKDLNDDENYLKSENPDHYEPTEEELKEYERVRLATAGQTMRQKKREKHQQRIEIQKDQLADKEKQRNEIYLQKWKSSRDQWKFEKLRQISIQLSILDETKIDDKIWPIALEYLSGTKGAAKDKIIKLAEEAIEQLDKEDNGQQGQLIDTAKYRRARELLQCFA